MRANIREELDPKNNIVSEYLNDNALFKVRKEQTPPLDTPVLSVVIQFINNFGVIQEHHLMIVDKNTRYEISEDKTAVAIYKTRENGTEEYLSQMYDVKNQGFIPEEFLDVAYPHKFPQQELNKYLVLMKKDG